MPEEAAVVPMLQAIGRYLTDTHQHERRPDPARPWLLAEAAPCVACRDLRAALGLEDGSGTP